MARILIVDDEQVVRDLLRVVLERDGHHVTEAGDGLAAVSALEASPYDVVLVDLILPKLNGLDTVTEMRARRPETRFIVMTGALPALLDRNRNMDELLGAGVTKLVKPMKPGDLIRAVRETLGSPVA